MRSLLFIGFFSLACNLSLIAEEWKKNYTNDYFIGAEVYGVERRKDGGSKQNGVLYGVRLGMDRVKRYHYYWGADYLWAEGFLKGKVESQRLKSKMTDSNLEGRFGYTLGCKNWRCASLTPFIGLGYFCEKNNYQHPSPLPIHFKNQFGYIPFGFLSQIFIIPKFSLGLNFKVRFLVDELVHISNDPNHENHIQHYAEKLQYRVDLPLSYFDCFCGKSTEISFVPFYEYRPYGYRVNFPFDFMETTFNLYGITLKIALIF